MPKTVVCLPILYRNCRLPKDSPANRNSVRLANIQANNGATFTSETTYLCLESVLLLLNVRPLEYNVSYSYLFLKLMGRQSFQEDQMTLGHKNLLWPLVSPKRSSCIKCLDVPCICLFFIHYLTQIVRFFGLLRRLWIIKCKIMAARTAAAISFRAIFKKKKKHK